MPRKAHPYYRAGRDTWFVTHNGKPTNLGVKGPENQAAALAAWEALKSAQTFAAGGPLPEPPEPPIAPQPVRQGPGIPVRVAVAGFLERRGPKVKPATLTAYRWGLGEFLAGLGPAADRPVAELTAEVVEATADRPGWSSSTRNSVLGTVATFLKWTGHPLPLRRPPKQSRGADSVLTDEQYHMVLGVARGDFRELLRVLRETGARPQEAAQLTVESVDWTNKLARLREHKQMRHGKDRTIFFSEAAFAVLERQRAKYRTGYLFRSRRGKPFGLFAIVQRCATISERVGFRVIAYGFRHTFATAALTAGVPDTIVAGLLGHAGTTMIHAHYSHVAAQAKVMRDAAQKASGQREAG